MMKSYWKITMLGGLILENKDYQHVHLGNDIIRLSKFEKEVVEIKRW